MRCVERTNRQISVLVASFLCLLTIAQAAATLDISVRTANRHWAYAKAWLYQQLSLPDDEAQ